jgi:hypothetical protein
MISLRRLGVYQDLAVGRARTLLTRALVANSLYRGQEISEMGTSKKSKSKVPN